MEGAVDKDIIRLLVERCDSLTVKEAIAFLASGRFAMHDIHLALIWLLKYGIVRVKGARPVEDYEQVATWPGPSPSSVAT